MKIKSKYLNIANQVAPLLPLLVPRITASIGFDEIVYGVTILFILIKQLFYIRLDSKSLGPLISAVACILLATINTLALGYQIDHRLMLFAATLMLFATQKPNENLAYGLYGFAIISVLLSIPMSFSNSVGFIIPASTYEVAGLERITFFFNEPSHYGILLALSFGIGITRNMPNWSQLFLLLGIGMTFSASSVITLFAVYIVNQSRNNGGLKTFFYVTIATIIGIFILTSVLVEIDSSGVINTRINQTINGFTTGFDYSSIGVRIASTLAGFDFISTALFSANIPLFLFGNSFEGVQSYAIMYYNNYFIDSIESEMFFNFVSTAFISGGLLGAILYLGTIDNVRRRNGISLSEWFTLIVCMSLVHGYLYGPLAFIFLLYGGLSISNMSNIKNQCLHLKSTIKST